MEYTIPPTSTHPVFPLKDVRLGDIVTLPDGRKLTVRSRCVLSHTRANIAGFVVLGEFEAVITTPASQSEPLGYFVPSVTPTFDHPDSPRTKDVGSARYWSPHLPPLDNSMGSIGYEVVEVRGSVHPQLVLERSGERVYFVRAGAVPQTGLEVTAMAGRAEAGPDLRQSWSPYPPTAAPVAEPAEDSLYDRALRGR